MFKIQYRAEGGHSWDTLDEYTSSEAWTMYREYILAFGTHKGATVRMVRRGEVVAETTF